jgi:hypothetical protein
MRTGPARTRSRGQGGVYFDDVNAAALAALRSLVKHWLPGGQFDGDEYVALNPKRADRHLGSFRINTRTGRWADFAVDNARGGDPIALVAYLGDLGQAVAAEKLAAMLGINARNA